MGRTLVRWVLGRGHHDHQGQIACMHFAADSSARQHLGLQLLRHARRGRDCQLDRRRSCIAMEQLKRIGDGYAVDIVDTAHKVRAGTLSPEDGLANVDRALASIEAYWNEYVSTTLTAEEKQIADRFAGVRADANKGVEELRQVLAAGDLNALSAFADNKLYPTIDPLGTDISRLIDLQIEVAKQNLVEGNELGATLTAFMVALSTIGAAVAAFSIWTVLRGVIRPSTQSRQQCPISPPATFRSRSTERAARTRSAKWPRLWRSSGTMRVSASVSERKRKRTGRSASRNASNANVHRLRKRRKSVSQLRASVTP